MIQPRWYQDEAEKSIFEYYGSGQTGNPVIAMPTASGKSVVIARFCSNVLQRWPRQRIAVVTHVKELIQQNYDKMLAVWPEAPAGIYSAGLSSRETALPIIFGGVQSMVNCAADFGHRDLMLVDECHLISGKDDSNYGKLVAGLKAINPYLNVIGFSATPYRTGTGLLSDGPLFTDICYDLTSLENFNRLIDEGFLCTLIPKRTKTELNVEDVAIQQGDYVKAALQKAVDKDALTYGACKEIVEQGHDRESWLVFASGIEHAQHIADTIHSFGIDVAVVHSKMKDEQRDKSINDFKHLRVRCVVNYGVLTTGFDHPALDLIAMLRPTTSTVLWVQMLGRGCRPYYAPGFDVSTTEGRLAAIAASSKPNCLVLDFAGNTKRLGPINDPVIPKKRGQKVGTAPVKICAACGTYNHARAEVCCNCGEKFELQPKLTIGASNEELIRQTNDNPIETYDVQRVLYHRFQSRKTDSPPMIQVSYYCGKQGLKMIKEYVCLEHKGHAGKLAFQWWLRRIGTVPPKSVDEALTFVSQLKVPRQILVKKNGKYDEVVTTIF